MGVRRGSVRDAGFTFAELMAVIAIVAVLVAIAIAAFGISTTHAKAIACQGNRRALEQSILAYTIDHGGEYPAQLSDLEPYVKAYNSLYECPAGDGTLLEWDSGSKRVVCPSHPD